MKMGIYGILDTKIGAFGARLHLELSDDAAIRNFSDGVNDQDRNNQLNKHPEDFAMYKLGTFHLETGILEPEKLLTCLVTASAVKTSSGNGQQDLPLVVN